MADTNDEQARLDRKVVERPVTVHYRSAITGAVQSAHGTTACSFNYGPDLSRPQVNIRLNQAFGPHGEYDVESTLVIPTGNIVSVEVFRGEHNVVDE